MTKDVKFMVKSDLPCLLPNIGWRLTKGANKEQLIAKMKKILTIIIIIILTIIIIVEKAWAKNKNKDNIVISILFNYF